MTLRVSLLAAFFTVAAVVPAHPQVDSARPAPRDTLFARSTLSGDLLRRLPIDDPRQAFTLVPGVVIRGGEIGIAAAPHLSIRGSLTPPSVYVDGAPMRLQIFGSQGLGVAPNGIADVAITTGVAPVFVVDAAGGVVSYETRTGGDRLAGNLRWDSDEPFGAGSTVGYNRIEGSVGGPLPVGPNVTFFVSTTLQGQRSSYRGMGAAAQPTYMPHGVDTVVTDTSGGSTQSVTMPRWVQWSGACSAASNEGVECQGLRRPMDWSTARRVQGKVAYRYGGGSSLSITGLTGDLQQRFFPGQVAAAPSLYSGARSSSFAAVVNWHQPLGGLRNGPIALNVNVSLARDQGVAGLLTPESETATRDPYLGIAFETMHFVGTDQMPFPVTDAIVRNVRTNTGLRTPYLNREDLRNRQPYRTNPYGLLTGWPSEGLDGRLSFFREQRLQGQWALDWRTEAHAVTVGADAERTDASFYTSALLRQAFMDLWVERPSRVGIFAADQFEVGGLVLDIGVRYDRFTPGGEFARIPGRIYSNPAWIPGSDTSDADYATSVGRVFTATASRGAVSPRARLSLPVSPSTSVRVSAARTVEPPAWGLYFGGQNNDLDFTSTFDFFARDVAFAAPWLLEVGVRSALGSNAALDVAVYRKDVPRYGGRLAPFADPLNPGDTITLNVLAALDADALGGDAQLAWRSGDWLAGAAVYSVTRTHMTFPGPGGAADASATRHALEVLAELHGSPSSALVRGAGAIVAFRWTRGLPFARLPNVGSGVITGGNPLGQFADSRLPATKALDIRVTKVVRAGNRDWTLFADLRNALNFRNTVALFAETGDVVNAQHRSLSLASEYANLANEAQLNSALLAGDAIDLSACGSWLNPVNCVALTRVERRFGDGDGIYSLTEQTRVLNASYDAFLGPWQFYGAGRTARVGVELGL